MLSRRSATVLANRPGDWGHPTLYTHQLFERNPMYYTLTTIDNVDPASSLQTAPSKQPRRIRAPLRWPQPTALRPRPTALRRRWRLRPTLRQPRHGTPGVANCGSEAPAPKGPPQVFAASCSIPAARQVPGTVPGTVPGPVPGTTTVGDPVFLPPITAPAEAPLHHGSGIRLQGLRVPACRFHV